MTAPYASISDVVTDRIHWALARMAQLLQRGRMEGWIAGDPVEMRSDLAGLDTVLAGRICVTKPALAPMQRLQSALELTAGQLDALWILASIEVSPAVARFSEAFGTPLSIQILRQLISLTTTELDHLLDLRLADVAEETQMPLQRRAIRANDRIVELASGEVRLDRELEQLASLCNRDTVPEGTCPATLEAALATSPRPVVIATGVHGSGRSTLLRRGARNIGLDVLCVSTRSLADQPRERRRQLRAVVREACLFHALPLFEEVEPERCAEIAEALEDFRGPILVTAREPLRWRNRPVVVFRVALPDHATRETLWRSTLPQGSPPAVLALAADYRLNPGAIAGAARNALALVANDHSRIDAPTIQSGVRSYIGEQIGSLAKLIEWRQNWDDLVLPADQCQQLLELVARVRHRGRVLEEWGFADKVGKGLGVSALFSGPPGTGKTMVAGLVAKELGLDLYQVDLSKVASKYIGETEKHLGALFDATESGHAILLFDEADAVFAKRSEVKSSNDRYANLEVNYLLQRIEAFSGIAILTTNHESSIDDAFRRRLAVHVRFPLPDDRQRAALWRSLVPGAAETEGDIDFARLAREFVMSGGYIRNAVLRAAYLAAEAGTAITMEHMYRSARLEYEALGKITYDHSALR